MNNIIWIIMDSCRYDSFESAKVAHFTKIGKLEKRYSYASWKRSAFPDSHVKTATAILSLAQSLWEILMARPFALRRRTPGYMILP